MAERIGSRWYEQPTGEEVAEWFIKNVRVHGGMKAEDWVSGVVLIESKENLNGERVPCWTPYIKVDARIAYWHAYLEKNTDVRGVIEPVFVAEISEGETYNAHLPAGFFVFPVRTDDKLVKSLGLSMRVKLLSRDTGDIVEEFPRGTKTVNILDRFGADENVVMKVETGAIGRALGMAGMLTIPGAGVASAEDVQEALRNEGQPAASTQIQEEHTEAKEPTDAELREELAKLMQALQEAAPNRHAHLQAWAQSRGIKTMDQLTSVALKGTIKKVEGELAAAEQEGDLAPVAEVGPQEAQE